MTSNSDALEPLPAFTPLTPSASSPLAAPQPLGRGAAPPAELPATLAATTLARHAPQQLAPAPAGPLQALMASFPDQQPAATYAFVRRRRPSQVPPPADPRGAPPGMQLLAADAGMPLPAAQRAEFEALVGGNLPDVRLHTGPPAAATARSLSADAFAKGNDVFFGEGQYDPVNPAGRALLAHELTHVRQQADAASVQPAPNSPAGELEAMTMERQVRHGETPAAQAVVIDRVVRRYTSRSQGIDGELSQRLDSLAERALLRAKELVAAQAPAAKTREVSRVSVPLTVNTGSSDEQIVGAWASAIAAAISSTLRS